MFNEIIAWARVRCYNGLNQNRVTPAVTRKQSCSSDFLGNGRIMAFPLLSSSAGKEFRNHQPFGWLLFFFILFRFSTLFVLWSRVLCSSHSEDDLTHKLLFIGWLLNYFVPRCFYFYFF